MKYKLELSNMHGDGLGEERLSVFESDTPITLPSPGDEVNLQGTREQVFVVNRRFSFYPDGNDVLQHVQIFCGSNEEYRTHCTNIASR